MAEFAEQLAEAFRRAGALLCAHLADGGRVPGPHFTATAGRMGLDSNLKPLSVQPVTPAKCQGWINLCSLAEELRPLVSVRVSCDVPAGEKHPADGDGDPLHRYRGIYWGARSVPEEGDDQ